ncbi:MAG TPA: sulfite oxidase [Chthonomonadaceae bacterium]|nr:sulfite oxidase [Chthonomonadaceae bacterium]
MGIDAAPEGSAAQRVEHGRRAFLARWTVWPLIAAGLLDGRNETVAQQARSRFPGLIIRQRQPENLEFPFDTLESFLTPSDRFYIRSHFAVPAVDAASWRLRIEGAVDRPLEIGLDDLHAMDSRVQPATLECAGNGRVFLAPAARGVQWELGAVSTAEWAGVPLAALLKRAGLRDSAVDVVLQGADSGEIKDPPKPAGPIPFARSIPVAKALRPETMLAFKMNGAEIPASHGFPVRAVVPGWYGVASVKWLARIVVLDRPFQGHFQTVEYATFDRRDGLPVRVPITELQIKASIARPVMHETVPAGRPYRITGAAWSGEAPIDRVDVSTDDGASWSPALLRGRTIPYCWRLWSFDWQAPALGRAVVMARATDATGRMQPLQRDADRDNYLVTHVLPIEIDVR